MTDKVQKIRKEVEKLKSNLIHGACSSQVAMETRCKEEAYNEVLAILDTMQEQHKETNFLDELKTKLDSMSKEEFRTVWEKYGAEYEAEEKEEPVSEELEEAAKHYLYSNILYDDVYVGNPTDKDCIEMFKAGAKWQKTKDESTTEDLGEYINEFSKQFPEVSFAKLSRIAVRVAKWQKEHLWKPDDGDNLPEIDREVIALTQPYPNDEHLKVVFAHRPNNKYAKVWNSDLGEEQVIELEWFGKGEWNIPFVKYWLDAKLPYEIKEK